MWCGTENRRQELDLNSFIAQGASGIPQRVQGLRVRRSCLYEIPSENNCCGREWIGGRQEQMQ